MKIGIASIFAFRPHVEHLAYLARLLECAGYEISGFDCVASVSRCYPRSLRETSKWVECPKCVFGGIRSYSIPVAKTVNQNDVESIDKTRLQQLTVSSVATSLRTESPRDLTMPEFVSRQEALFPSMEAVYGSARRWIRDEGLEGVIFFNGRMDLTAALRAACEDEAVPFIASERAWMGHGISLMPNGNCLDIAPASLLCHEFMDKPLTETQVRIAGKIAAERFLRENKFEWRLYNTNEERAEWPGVGKGPRVLIIPSSRNEFEGHQERVCPWGDYTEAMSKVLGQLAASPNNIVLRCHPNWAENIGRRTGERSESHYTEWAKCEGIRVVPAADKRSTYDLIKQADIILVNGSSAGVEAGILGKKIVSVGHCIYESAGFSVQIHDDSQFDRVRELENHDRREVVRRTLRYIYLHARRLTQFVNYVRAESTTAYRYFEGADVERLIRIFKEGRLRADDDTYAKTQDAEDRILEKVLQEQWGELNEYEESGLNSAVFPVKRRAGLRWIDSVRSRLPRGDR